ncbi:TPA: stage II sporulation protein M [archaeon]|nr:stage II sporulation protein M [Candidatus Undinarchaeales archaeon SRR5007147.bin71]
MVLEMIMKPEYAQKSPIKTLLLGFGVSSLALWISYLATLWLPSYIFPEHANSWFLFLTAVALIPFLNKIYLIEEREAERIYEKNILRRHEDLLFIYIFLFLGMILSFSFWFTILPLKISQIVFSGQVAEIYRIQGLKTSLSGALIATGAGAITGNILAKITGYATSRVAFLKLIMFNNVRLLLLFMVFSFVFGAGAILLLTWNAAVVGVAMGFIIRDSILVSANVLLKSAFYLKELPFSFMSFFLHGIFEIVGYFAGAISGGIFSVAILRGMHKTKHFKTILKDVIFFLVLALALVGIGAVLEVYVTPLL